MGAATSCIKAPAAPPATGSAPSNAKTAENVVSQAAAAVGNKLVETVKTVEKAVTTVANAVVDTVVKAVKPTIGCAVSTPYGLGVLDQIRPDGFAVVKLDFGATAYLNMDQVTFAPVPKVGSECSTVYGDGVLKEIRESDGMCVVALKFGATAYLRKEQVRPLRAYPFVPASFWTSGIFSAVSTVSPFADVAADKTSRDIKLDAGEAPAKITQDGAKAEEPSPAHPLEEKDASDAPEAKTTTQAAATEASVEATPASEETSKKKKKKKKH